MNSFDFLYQDILHDIVRGDHSSNRTGIDTTSRFGYGIEWDMRDGFPMLSLRKLNIKWPAVELEWMLGGQSDTKWLKQVGCKIWEQWEDILATRHPGKYEPGALGRVYGAQWRSFGQPAGGCDQLKTLCETLRTDPTSRRMIISAWSPNELADMALPPCHSMFQFSVKNGFMDLMVVQRSMDFPVGGPHDIAQFGLFLELMARANGLTARRLFISVGDLHIYDNQREACDEMLKRLPMTAPTLDMCVRASASNYEDVIRFNFQDVFLSYYEPHPPIKIPVAV